MARSFKYSIARRIVNRVLTLMLARGISPENYYLLTVPGRKTGKLHTIPVALVTQGRKRWLVAPYGAVDWVKNARVAGEVLLTRGERSERWSLRELPFNEAAPILKSYIERYPITRPYFNATIESPEVEFVNDAETRPVFELILSEGKGDA